MDTSTSFVQAFQASFATYQEASLQNTVEIAIKEMGMPSDTALYRDALANTIIGHCICASKNPEGHGGEKGQNE
ncbi:hypothetical protein DXG01_009974 [Tephrocybe rancida]|nr:hypothetical protein DXG01_009974 [Tephrocybe rancida]